MNCKLVPMEEFSRIQRLPPYVFNITGEMKVTARRRGEDIIDFGMGNPDGATPKHIVDKMIEAAQKPVTHRYSVSRGTAAAAAGHLQLVQDALRCRPRPRHRGHRHHRIEGRHRPPLPRHSRLARHGAGAEPQLSDPHLWPGHCGSARGERPDCRPRADFWPSSRTSSRA